jgi:hypothetical protein
MPHTSKCEPDSARNLLYDVLGLDSGNIDKIERLGILSKHVAMNNDQIGGNTRPKIEDDFLAPGCWMPRRADAVALIVVDALRFDFALEHLPKSVGAKLVEERQRRSQRQQASVKSDSMVGGNDKPRDSIGIQSDVPPLGQSQLYQFVADPPTVTMQRLKGLTTGGLPTFADISGSFGGATVDEDSWVQQLHDVPSSRRGILKENDSSGYNQTANERRGMVKMAFVGDDTWVDLFPTQFDDRHPFPSFNTRDLDTVDNGCLLHLPRLLDSFGRNVLGSNKDNEKNVAVPYFEMLVAHFLGVDHVGHTYGPHNV